MGGNEIQRCWNKSTYGRRNRRAMKSVFNGLLEDSSSRPRMTVVGNAEIHSDFLYIGLHIDICADILYNGVITQRKAIKPWRN